MRNIMKHSKKWLVVLLLALAIVPAVAEAQIRSGGGFNSSRAGSSNLSCRGEALSLFERFTTVQSIINTIVNCNRDGRVYDSNTGTCAAPILSPEHVFTQRDSGATLAFIQTDGSTGTAATVGGAKGADIDCSVTPPADPADCRAPWGATVADGGRVRAYQTASVPNGQTCNSEWRNCDNGNLLGSYQYRNCVVGDPPVDPPVGPASCDLPWGGTIAHNGDVQAYETASVASTQTCNSEMRHCDDGNLSGSFTNRSCSQRDPVTTCGNVMQYDQDGPCSTGATGREIPYCNHIDFYQMFCQRSPNCSFRDFTYVMNRCDRCEVTFRKCITQ